MPETKDKRRILFVDDESEFLDLIERLFTTWGKGDWHIFTATNTGKALTILAEQSIDLVVIDMLMPVVDGLQFIKLLNRKYPNLTKAALTGHDDETYRAACLSNGAELYLIKPSSMEGLQTVFENLNGIVSLQQQSGFRGVLRRVGIEDVLQLECLGAKSSVLEVVTANSRGRIYIHDGRVIHAEEGELMGTDAFNRILGHRGGEFNLKAFSEPPAITIEESWEMLVMEAARINDEAGGPPPEATPKPSSGDTEYVPLPWERHDFVGHAEIAKEPEPKAAEVAPPVPQPKSTNLEQLKPRVEELLVCSPQGDVLYEWQCGNTEGVIQMLEFITQQSRVLSQALPLGRLERLEVDDSNSRTVAQIKPDYAAVVRTSNSPLKALITGA